MKSNHAVFFSYAWGDDKETGESREKIVDELYASLQKDGYHVVRDKYDLGYRGLISEFMHKIGEGNYIIVVISQKYVRSPYCMFELYEIARRANFDKRLFGEKVLPVMVEHINFADPAIINELLSYWEDEYTRWDELVKKRSGQLAVEQMERYNKIKMVYQNVGKLIDWLTDMNTLNLSLLKTDDFAEIKKAIGAGKSTTQNEAEKTTAENPPAPNGKKTHRPTFKLANIRTFLENALSDTELSSLCMDHFEQVYNRFGDGQNKSQKINLLLDFCRKNFQFDVLLEAMHELNAVQFELHKPYL